MQTLLQPRLLYRIALYPCRSSGWTSQIPEPEVFSEIHIKFGVVRSTKTGQDGRTLIPVSRTLLPSSSCSSSRSIIFSDRFAAASTLVPTVSLNVVIWLWLSRMSSLTDETASRKLTSLASVNPTRSLVICLMRSSRMCSALIFSESKSCAKSWFWFRRRVI